jgi:hypothetical protein
MTLVKPIAATDLEPEWYERVQEAIRISSARVRASPERPTIQVWSDGRGSWLDLNLPSGTTHFISYEDRNTVLARVRGR